jgi:RNA-dependent RNA polymerase
MYVSMSFSLARIHQRDADPFGTGRTGIRPRSGELIADGCGFMNRTAFDLLTQQAGWPELRCAVQGRLGGSKGVWLLHPNYQLPDGSPPRVWIRDSQKKITHGPSLGPDDGRSRAYCILDLLAPARLTFPARLNRQTIVNLSYNRVPTRVFAEMLEAAVQKDFEDLTTWEGEEAMEFLLANVMRLGGVSGARSARKAGTMARVQGLRGREMEDVPSSQASDLGFIEEELERGTSGAPPSLWEKIFDMIIAGFHPLRSEVLYDALGRAILHLIRTYVYECKIPIPQSCEAFIVPGAWTRPLFGGALLMTACRSLWDTRT